MQKNNQYGSIARYALFVGVLLILFSCMINNLSAIVDILSLVLRVLKPFLIGLIIAYLLHGPVGALELYMENNRFLKKRKQGLRRCLAVTIVYLSTLAITVLLLYIVLPEVVRSLGLLITKIQPMANDVAQWLSGLLEQINIPQQNIAAIFTSLESIAATLLASMGNIAAGAYDLMIAFVTGAFNLAIGILISIYMIYGRERFAQQIKKLLYATWKVNTADVIVSIARRSNRVFSIFLYVRIVCSVMVGVVTYAVLAPFGVYYVVLISVISGVFNLIPIFGPIVGTGVCSLLLVIVSPAQMLWYLLLSIILQQIEGNVIEPKMMGDRMGLPTFWVLFGVLVGGGFFGIGGMVAGVPVVAITYSLIQALVKSRLKKKDIEYC